MGIGNSIFDIDFDGDGYLNASDMETALRYITNNELEQEELEYLTSKIIGRTSTAQDAEWTRKLYSRYINYTAVQFNYFCIKFFSLAEEADLDEDKKLSEVEFELMLSKCPDFLGWVVNCLYYV